MVKSPYRPTSDSYGDRCGMLVTVVFSCIKHEAITSLWALIEKPFDNLHFLQNISQKIQSLWEYLWGTILMARSGTFVYMRYASAVGLLPWEGEMGSSQTWCQHCDVTSECEKTDSDMGLHFNSGGHRGLADVEITILDFIHCSPNSTSAQKLRNTIERNWMFKLRTQVPFGMNLIDAPIYWVHPPQPNPPPSDTCLV